MTYMPALRCCCGCDTVFVGDSEESFEAFLAHYWGEVDPHGNAIEGVEYEHIRIPVTILFRGQEIVVNFDNFTGIFVDAKTYIKSKEA